MSGSLKTYRDKVKSIGNILKISKTMHIVSLSRMKFFQKELEAYEKIYLNDLIPVFSRFNLDHNPLSFTGKERELNLFITSDRGLNGNYSHAVTQFLNKKDFNYIIGTKGIVYAKAMSIPYKKAWNKLDYLKISENTALIRDEILNFIKNNLNSISSFSIIYMHHYSFTRHTVVKSDIFSNIQNDIKNRSEEKNKIQQEFYPSESTILENLISRYIYNKIYYSYRHALTSEYNMRANSMEKANTNAKELQSQYQLEINKKRQEKITQEIIEVVSNMKS